MVEGGALSQSSPPAFELEMDKRHGGLRVDSPLPSSPLPPLALTTFTFFPPLYPGMQQQQSQCSAQNQARQRMHFHMTYT